MRTIILGLLLHVMAVRCDALTLRFLAWDHEIAGMSILVRNGEKETQIKELHPDKRSNAIDGGSPGSAVSLVFSGADGATSSSPGVALAIPEGISDALVILLPDPSSRGKVRPFVVNDSMDSFRPGTTRFLVASSLGYEVRCESKAVRLPGGWVPTDVTLEGTVRNVGVQIQTSQVPKTLVYSAVWEYNPSVRKLAIVVPSEDRDIRSVLVKTFIDRR